MATPANEISPNIRVDVSTYCLVQTGTEIVEGKEVPVVEFMTENAAKKTEEEKKGTILAAQSFQRFGATTLEGISELVPDVEEATKLFNRGADNKQYQVIRSLMLAQDEDGNFTFEQVEGSISLREALAEKTASRATSIDAKVEKVLSGLDPETRSRILAQLLEKSQQAVAQ
jgi:hypothetical protein